MSSDPYQQNAFAILSLACAMRSPDTDFAAERAAKSLASSTAKSCEPSPGVCNWSTILALHQLATEQPSAIDFLLRIYEQTCKLYPSSVTNEYGSGEEAGIKQLRWWLIDEADCFDFVEPSTGVGEVDAEDRSNLSFSEGNINVNLNDVLLRAEEWRARRTKLIISMAIMSRCFASNIVREKDGKQAAGLISVAFQRHSRWTEADFVGNCILLRGCANALLETVDDGTKQRQEWMDNLKAFLNPRRGTEKNGFALQYHAALALRNLIEGPFDETSHQIFSPDLWIH